MTEGQFETGLFILKLNINWYFFLKKLFTCKVY